jgi:hypothetical protein
MPEKKTRERAARAKREGKAPSTQAGAFVEEEIEHVREGKHGARSTAQAIAIGLSKARRAGIAVPRRAGAKKASAKKAGAEKATAKKASATKKAATKKAAARRPGSTSAKRSRATTQALKREGRQAGSHAAVSRQARAAARKRSAASRSAAAKKAARTKGEGGRSAAARKGARTRARRSR